MLTPDSDKIYCQCQYFFTYLIHYIFIIPIHPPLSKCWKTKFLHNTENYTFPFVSLVTNSISTLMKSLILDKNYSIVYSWQTFNLTVSINKSKYMIIRKQTNWISHGNYLEMNIKATEYWRMNVDRYIEQRLFLEH